MRLTNLMEKIIRSIKRIPDVILHPIKYFSAENELGLDGTLVTLAVVIVTALSKLSWSQLIGQPVTVGEAFTSSALNTTMAWTGFFAVYYFAMVIFRKRTNLADLFGAAGSAGFPLLLVTLISALLWWLGSILAIPVSIPAWSFIQNVSSWLGVALSWPGLMAYFIFRYRLGLKGIWSVILPVVLMAGLIASWLVSL